ncbi:response regulator [Marinobacterium jannaschii]|uniref:response regulator n=1 Tax=Marinobacterium jannaschii TaxID=64970 RepID=UPI0004888793|nr:response regulator [Marinobacterium jannaschii]
MKIGTLGFPADQQTKLEKIFKLSRSNRYELVAFDPDALPDLLLLFGTEQLDTETAQALPESFHSRLIITSREQPVNSNYTHLGFPLVSSRVIRTLDRVTNENEDLEPDLIARAAAEAESRFSKYIEAARQAAAAAAEHKIKRDQDRGPHRVLVVDDSAPMQQALAHELRQLDDEVDITFADDGEAALERVAEKPFDFIFLDIMMPGIDGFETCTRMRQIAELKKTPIIMLSAKTSPLDEVKGIMSGCSTYLTKPINHEEFQKVIKRVSSWISEFQTA